MSHTFLQSLTLPNNTSPYLITNNGYVFSVEITEGQQNKWIPIAEIKNTSCPFVLSINISNIGSIMLYYCNGNFYHLGGQLPSNWSITNIALYKNNTIIIKTTSAITSTFSVIGVAASPLDNENTITVQETGITSSFSFAGLNNIAQIYSGTLSPQDNIDFQNAPTGSLYIQYSANAQ